MLYVSRLSGRFFAGALAAFLLVTGLVAWDTWRYLDFMESNNYSFQSDKGLYEKHKRWSPSTTTSATGFCPSWTPTRSTRWASAGTSASP